jgi:hypothetical protein
MVFPSVPESPECYFRLLDFLGAEVDDSWRCSFAKRLYLVAKLSHMGGGGVDVDGLACPLHRSMAHSYQARG